MHLKYKDKTRYKRTIWCIRNVFKHLQITWTVVHKADGGLQVHLIMVLIHLRFVPCCPFSRYSNPIQATPNGSSGMRQLVQACSCNYSSLQAAGGGGITAEAQGPCSIKYTRETPPENKLMLLILYPKFSNLNQLIFLIRL